MEGETTTPRRPSGRRRRAIVAVAGVGLALSAGVAYGATHSSSSPGAAVLDDAAKRLGVSSATLRSALQQATIDQINKQVTAGHLTRSQADAIIARIKQGDGFGLGFGGPPGGFGHHGFGEFDHHGPPGGPFGFMDGVSTYLGLTDTQLRTQLMSGKSLADVAKAQGKSVSGLEAAIVSAATKRLDQAVKDGHLTAAQEKRFLAGIKQHADDLVTHGFGEHRPPMGDGGTSSDTGAGSPPPGGPWT